VQQPPKPKWQNGGPGARWRAVAIKRGIPPPLTPPPMCCYRKLDETFSYGAARYQRYSPELTQPNRIEVCSERRSNGNDAALMHDE